MGQGKKPNAARDHAHAHRRAHRLAAKRLSLCIILGTFGVLALVPASAHAITMTKPERQMLALVNHVRATHGLAQLKAVSSLERASRSHSCEMLRREYFSHSSYNGESFAARLRRFGYTTSGCRSLTVGEDIAYGWGPGSTVKALFSAWMHSPAHRAVILTRCFRNVGVGRAAGTFRGASGFVFFTLDCGVRIR